MNMTLEVDVLYLKQIEQRYLPKLRRLFYLISLEAPCTPNISQLSKDLEMSRATVMNYIKYLKDARLVNMLYPIGEEFPKKPSTVHVYNTNLLHVVNHETIKESSEYKSFFLNQIQKDYQINEGIKDSDFIVENKYKFCIKTDKSFRNNPNYYYAAHAETGEDNVIPLWLFGFLY
jgi:predicted AAA+ superfamily ATPase